MVLFGIGIDIVETKRIEDSFEKFGESFRDRVFTAAEIEYCESMKNPLPHYAARFAAKEAVSKALGTGIAEGVSWQDIEVQRGESGAPSIQLSGEAKKLAEKESIIEVQISLSHSDHYSAANAVMMASGEQAG